MTTGRIGKCLLRSAKSFVQSSINTGLKIWNVYDCELLDGGYIEDDQAEHPLSSVLGTYIMCPFLPVTLQQRVPL